jgi:hypothetical protein
VGKAHCGRTARCTDCPLLGDLQHVRSMEPGRTSR